MNDALNFIRTPHRRLRFKIEGVIYYYYYIKINFDILLYPLLGKLQVVTLDQG
jgi:hypothetical protein